MKAKDQDELVFLPLGGSNEIGMNFNLYGYGPPHARKWIVVDLGVTFGDQTTPGVEIILPDPEFIREHAKDILGIVLTHAHEDHAELRRFRRDDHVERRDHGHADPDGGPVDRCDQWL